MTGQELINLICLSVAISAGKKKKKAVLHILCISFVLKLAVFNFKHEMYAPRPRAPLKKGPTIILILHCGVKLFLVIFSMFQFCWHTHPHVHWK